MTQSDLTPKYEKAYQVILKRLKSGLYPIGGRMPTESELAAQFDVSRVTIRKTLDMLVQDGYIESKQGSGYRVLTLSPASDTCLTSFTDAMLRAGHEPTSKFLSLDHFTKGAAKLAELPDALQDMDITRVVRLRLVDETPRMLVMTYAPTRLLKNATAADFPEKGPGQSILRILSARFKLDWSAACEDISPVIADENLSEIFEVALGYPLLKQACSAFDDQGAMVFHEDVFRNGPVSFNLSQSSRTPRHL
ncbi:GntR family transcriptional regulator [Rhodobacteraceae bacterium]|nr:GntR family transcriptional regulator [Paracoccaceae bacterium]